MAKEIERKFVLRDLPAKVEETAQKYYIEQYYLIIENKSEARVRLKEDIETGKKEYFLTIKSGEGLQREETEIHINESQFIILSSSAIKGLKKWRLKTPNGFEIDIYNERLSHLSVVEVEFASEEEANTFVPPHWFGEEVTENAKYKNKNLAYELPHLDKLP